MGFSQAEFGAVPQGNFRKQVRQTVRVPVLGELLDEILADLNAEARIVVIKIEVEVLSGDGEGENLMKQDLNSGTKLRLQPHKIHFKIERLIHSRSSLVTGEETSRAVVGLAPDIRSTRGIPSKTS